MTVEEQLKKLILLKYKSIRAFALDNSIAYSTIDSVFKRGVSSTSITTIQKICKALNISMDDIADGNLISDGKMPEKVSRDEYDLLLRYRALSKHSRCLVSDIINAVEKHDRITPTIITKYRIPYYSEPVSAGTGQYLDYTSLQTMTINTPPPIGADFILRVIGDSMEPEYSDGGLVFVRIQKTVEIGEVGIFFSEGNVFMKVRGEDGLESLNKKYPTIEGNKDIKCIGKVVGKLDWSNVVEHC